MDNQKGKIIKKIVKKAIIMAIKPIIVGLLLVAIIVTLITGFLNIITVNDGTVQEGNLGNVPYVSNQYVDSIEIDDEGNITTEKSAKEIWDTIIENHGNIEKYLNNAKELKKILNAEKITEFLDTRPNPDDDISWSDDPDSKNIQGIVKLRRKMVDETVKTLSYKSPEEFEALIDKFNQTKSETDKEEAMSYFTLEKGNIFSNSGTAEKIESGTIINIPNKIGKPKSYEAWQKITIPGTPAYKFKERVGMNFDDEGFGVVNGRYVIACTTTFGSVGDYVDFYQDDGIIIPCIIGDEKSGKDENWNEWGHFIEKINDTNIIEFIVDKDSWYGKKDNPGTPTNHIEWNKPVEKAINGGNYFDNPDFGKDVIEGNNNVEENIMPKTNKYYAKVATWEKVTESIDTNDPNVQPMEETSETKMLKSSPIDYQSMLSGYSMPFEFLWGFLLIGQDKNFVLELADLVYNSSIEITVHDNLITNTNKIIDNKTMNTEIETNATVAIQYNSAYVPEGYINNSPIRRDLISTQTPLKPAQPIEKPIETTHKKETTTNNLQIDVTKADVWVVDYTKEYKFEENGTEEQPEKPSKEETYEDETRPIEPNKVDGGDPEGLAEGFKNDKKREYESIHQGVKANIVSCETKYYNYETNRVKKIYDNTKEKKYIASPGNIRGKVEPNSNESNFVNIFLKDEYAKMRANINSAKGWLFQILEKNESTANMVDLVKYLLFKASGKSYGVDSFDFEIYKPENFKPIVSFGSGNIADFLKAADEVHREQMSWSYAVDSRLSWKNIERAMNNPNKVTCCSTYVSCVIYRAGYASAEQLNNELENHNSSNSLYNYFKGKGWQEITSYDMLEPGDIVFMNTKKENKSNIDHVQIFAGNDTWYNAGSTDAIRRANPYSQGKKWPRENFYIALRPSPII